MGKYRILRQTIILGLTLTLLSACAKQRVDLFWDGQWTRTVTVPKRVQGRCFEETLTIHGKHWQLFAVVHSTFACDQPFLELTYEGTLDEVQIRRNTDDRDVRFLVKDIHLAAMADIAGSQRDELSEGAVEKLSEKYVPAEFQRFEQQAWFDAKHNTMRSNLFRPILDLATPAYPNKDKQLVYKRAGL